MLKDLGVTWVILGHSERREYFKESDEVQKTYYLPEMPHRLTISLEWVFLSIFA
jgi:triosephosphate isomerase